MGTVSIRDQHPGATAWLDPRANGMFYRTGRKNLVGELVRHCTSPASTNDFPSTSIVNFYLDFGLGHLDRFVFLNLYRNGPNISF